MKDFPDSFVSDVVVDDFGHSDSEDVSDRSVPEHIEFVNVGLSEGPGLATP